MNKYGIDKENIRKIYNLLDKTSKLLTRNKIDYWIDSGTLLGAVRHGGMIPWDDDADMSCYNRDKKKIYGLKRHLNRLGLDICKVSYGFKVFYKDGELIKKNNWRDHKNKILRRYKSSNRKLAWDKVRSILLKEASKSYKKSKKVSYEKYKYPFLDIFLTKLSKKGDRVVYLNNKWRNCYFNKDDMSNKKTYKFRNLKLKGVKNYKNYLDKCYGDNWGKIGKMTYDHKLEKKIPEKIIILTKKNRIYGDY